MTVTIHRREAGLAHLQLCSDDAPYLGTDAISGLADAVAALNADITIRVVIVTGGARRFCLGATRETLIASDAAARIAALTETLPRHLLAIDVPTIAAMAGHAVGGGFALGLWCDLIFLGAESLYGANFVSLGFTPGMGATVVVEELLGTALARELLMSGRMMQGSDLAVAAPAIARLVHPRDQLVAIAEQLAIEIAAGPRDVLVQLKRSTTRRRRAALDAALEDETAMHAALFADPATVARIAEAYPVLVEDS